MKVKYRVCDLCGDELCHDGDVRIKYKAKRHNERWITFYETEWKNIDICTNCLNKIIDQAIKECDT